MYRRIRTWQERRNNLGRNRLEIDGYWIKIRPRRNFANLPTSWDDVENSGWRDRSWKRYRKTQYK